MAIYQGTKFEANFTLTDGDGDALNISGWTFEAHFRDDLDDTETLVELTSAAEDFEILSAADGRLQMTIAAADTADFPLGKVVFDVLRTDDGDPVWLFGGSVKVKKPVTRDE